MITITLARFPLSNEALGPRVVLYEYLGGDVSLGPWTPTPYQTGIKLFFGIIF